MGSNILTTKRLNAVGVLLLADVGAIHADEDIPVKIRKVKPVKFMGFERLLFLPDRGSVRTPTANWKFGIVAAGATIGDECAGAQQGKQKKSEEEPVCVRA